MNHSMQSQSPPLAHEVNLMRVSCSTVKNTNQSLSTKTGSLDPFPTYVIKNYVDFLSPVITNIVNQSLTVDTGVSFTLELITCSSTSEKG